MVSLITLLPPYYFFHTLITALFLPGDIISMIFTIIIFWNLGRMIENRFGPKFLTMLYLIPGLATLAAGLILQYLFLLAFGNEVLVSTAGIYGMSANSGIFNGFIAFFCFFAGLETQLSFILFFVPLRLKAKHVLYLIIGLDVVFGALGFVGFGDPITSFASLIGIVAAYLIFKKYRSQLVPSQFYDRM